jgi:peroxiredoxin
LGPIHRMRRVFRAIAGVAGVLLALLAPPALGGLALPGLLQALDLASYAPGDTPPSFGGRTVDGRPVSLATLRGRVILINFWASWCAECRPEMPALEHLHREYGSRGLTVLGINARERGEAVQVYAKELGLTFPLLLDSQGEIGALFGVIGLPTTFLIARDGRAVARAIGPRAWNSRPARAIIEALLVESAVQSRRR